MCGAVCVFCFFHSGIGGWQTSANAATAFACEQSYFIHRRKAIIFRIEMLKGISSDTPDRILPLQLRQIKATDLAQVRIGREKLLSAHTTRRIAPLSFIFFPVSLFVFKLPVPGEIPVVQRRSIPSYASRTKGIGGNFLHSSYGRFHMTPRRAVPVLLFVYP